MYEFCFDLALLRQGQEVVTDYYSEGGKNILMPQTRAKKQEGDYNLLF